jgi:aspartate aminotransferase
MKAAARKKGSPLASLRARDLEAQSRRGAPPDSAEMVRLDSGDPDIITPLPIREAMNAALEAGIVHYAHPQGDPDLRKALSELVSGVAGQTYGVDQIVVTHGATGGLAAAILGLVDPGETVVIPEPTYSLYTDLVQLAGGRIKYVPTSAPDFELDLDRLASALPGAKLLILCNPCNPTGAVYSAATLHGVAELALQHGVYVLADEAYSQIVYDGGSHTSVLELELHDRAVYVQSFSKTYAMTGWRIGYIAADRDLASAFTRIHRTLNGPVNSAVQRAALAAVNIDRTWATRMLGDYARRRNLVIEGLAGSAATFAPPAGTFYAFVQHPAGLTSIEMATLCARHGVAVRPGSEYGPSGEGHLRLAFSASPDDIVEGVDRLQGALREAANVELRA